MIERDRAREVYETFLRRQVDPALLERRVGNGFQARVYPIPPRGKKQLILSYTQELASGRDRLRLPLRGLPRVGTLSVRILRRVGERFEERTLRRRDHLSEHDVEAPASPSVEGLRHGRLAVARVRPEIRAAEDPVASLLVLVDTSASMEGELAGLVQRLAALGPALADRYPRARLGVAAFDQEVVPVFEGSAARLAPADLGVAAAAWVRRAPGLRQRIDAALLASGVQRATPPSLSATLMWESDASDLDLGLRAGRRWLRPAQNVRTGYGPERLALEAGPQAVEVCVDAPSLGPTGYALGEVQLVAHDGEGRVVIEDRPFAIMHDGSRVELGRWDGRAQTPAARAVPGASASINSSAAGPARR